MIENVHIFPGIPELLQKKFESIRARFQGVPFVLRRVYVRSRESMVRLTASSTMMVSA